MKHQSLILWIACAATTISLCGCGNGIVTGACAAARCQERGKNCGEIVVAGCSVVRCGDCQAPQTCGGGGTPNVCGEGTCTPTTCTEQGLSCGTTSDGCGRVLDCGACPNETPVETPVFLPPSADYSQALEVSIVTATPGATIYYTEDGSPEEPKESDPVYTGPLAVSATTTIAAKAFKVGMTPSATAYGSYVIASSAHATINADKTLNINGRRVFPTIMYYICDQWDEAKEPCAASMARVGTNYTIDYWPAGSTEWWETVHQPAISGYPILVGWTAGRKAPTVLSDDRRFFFYAGWDEPTYSNGWTSQQSWYKARHADDPDHPVFMNVASGPEQVRAVDALAYSDALMLSNYPNLYNYIAPPRGNNPDYPGYGDMFYSMQTNSIKTIMKGHEASYFDKPIFEFAKPIYQICWTMGKFAEGYFLLTEQELRTCTWTGVTMNFSGAAFYTYKRIGSGTDVTLNMNDTALQEANKIAAEIRALNDILVLPTQHYQHFEHRDTFVSFDKELTSIAYPTGHPSKNLNYILKTSGSILYLVVVNVDSRSMIDVTISIDGLSGEMTAQTLGTQTSGSSKAGRTLSVLNGKFLEPAIDGFAVHIYRICSGTCPGA